MVEVQCLVHNSQGLHLCVAMDTVAVIVSLYACLCIILVALLALSLVCPSSPVCVTSAFQVLQGERSVLY